MSHEHEVSYLKWGKLKEIISAFITSIWIVLAICCFVYVFTRGDSMETKLLTPVTITVKTTHIFDARCGYTVIKYSKIGLTYYAVGEPTVPGTTASSGRHAYVGSIAVSQDFLRDGRVSFGDIVWEKTTNRFYTVEDTMAPRYKNRIDIFTNDLKKATTAGSSVTDIIIVRSLKSDVVKRIL